MHLIPLDNPSRIELHDGPSDDWLATFTLGCRTVVMCGPERTIREGESIVGEVTVGAAEVKHRVWVRLLRKPFEGHINERWFRSALASNEAGRPDVLAIAMQYVHGAPPLVSKKTGLTYAGNASYGPEIIDEQGKKTRQEGSDFYDYLGIPRRFLKDLRVPDAKQKGCLDCSGFVRMVYGYRNSGPVGFRGRVPLIYTPTEKRSRLPRRAIQMCRHAPGVRVVRDSGHRVTEPRHFFALQPGDLLFFNVSGNDGALVDHVGIYVGRDSDGHYRFLSSRKSSDGPTMGDPRDTANPETNSHGGRSILDSEDEKDTYARGFRAVRRL